MIKIENEEVALKLIAVINSFTAKATVGNPPTFVIVTGGVGVGKTTIRRQRYAEGYVHFDFGEILTAVIKEFGKENPDLVAYVDIACKSIIKECLEKRYNVVIEIIGDKEEIFTPVIKKFEAMGYKSDFAYVDCDPKTACLRHMKAVQEDPDYQTAYYDQEGTLTYVYEQLGLGPLPDMGIVPPQC